MPEVTNTQRCAAINGAGIGEVIEADIPPLSAGEVLLEVHASLISPGTEMATAKTRRETPDAAAPPQAFGYANAGMIIATNGDCGSLAKGMRVAAMGAGHARHADYARVPCNLVVPLPDTVQYEQAAYACLGATALQAVRRTEVVLGAYGCVLGAGIVGNLAAQLSQLSGARVAIWDQFPARLDIAQASGVTTAINFMTADAVAMTQELAAPYGLDFAIFAFGGQANKALSQIKSCMKLSADGHRMGTITLVGACEMLLAGGAAMGNLDIRASSRTGPGYHDPAYEYGADYPSAFVPFTTQRNLQEIITLIGEERLKVDDMTTHTFVLDDIDKAIDALVEHPEDTLGVILKMR